MTDEKSQPMSTLLTLLRTPSYGWSGDAMAIDCSTAEMAADEIDRLTSELASLRARCEAMEAALGRARSHIVTLGGGYNGQAYGDKIHMAVLDQIDAALQSSGEARTP